MTPPSRLRSTTSQRTARALHPTRRGWQPPHSRRRIRRRSIPTPRQPRRRSAASHPRPGRERCSRRGPVHRPARGAAVSRSEDRQLPVPSRAAVGAHQAPRRRVGDRSAEPAPGDRRRRSRRAGTVQQALRRDPSAASADRQHEPPRHPAAALDTRVAKTYITDGESLNERWTCELAELGIDAPGSARRADRARRGAYPDLVSDTQPIIRDVTRSAFAPAGLPRPRRRSIGATSSRSPRSTHRRAQASARSRTPRRR